MTPPAPPRRAYRRTKAEQTELEAQAVRVCLQLFTDGGYEAISMRKLAAEVGVAPMSLYRYFPTKAHLMRHVWDDILARACEQAVLGMPKAGAPLPRLRAFADGFLQYWLENRDHYWVVFAIRDDLSELHADASSDVLRPNPQHVLAELSALLDDCHRALPTRFPPGDGENGVELLFQRLLGFLLSVIGLSSVPWTDIASLKNDLLDSIEQQLRGRLASAGKPSPSGRLA